MSFKDILKKFGGNNLKKELLKQAQMEDSVGETLEERKKSANQRELEGYYKEDNEKSIKEELERMRKRRQDETNFGHNPLNAKNVLVNQDWEVLKSKNLFKKKDNMFTNQEFIHKNNPNLLKNNPMLFGR